MEFNPHLKPWVQPHPNRGPAKGEIERPGHAENIAWQTRSAPPTEYEVQLGDALERVFEAGAVELSDVVSGLNACGMRTVEGALWTEASFCDAMRRLASR